jgi:hypothetical protein
MYTRRLLSARAWAASLITAQEAQPSILIPAGRSATAPVYGRRFREDAGSIPKIEVVQVRR